MLHFPKHMKYSCVGRSDRLTASTPPEKPTRNWSNFRNHQISPILAKSSAWGGGNIPLYPPPAHIWYDSRRPNIEYESTWGARRTCGSTIGGCGIPKGDEETDYETEEDQMAGPRYAETRHSDQRTNREENCSSSQGTGAPISRMRR